MPDELDGDTLRPASVALPPPRLARFLAHPVTHPAPPSPSLSANAPQHVYPPTPSRSSSGGVALKSPASYSHYPRHNSRHKPIPAPTVFARHAAPLHLPNLDEYLSSIPPPVFLEKDGSDKFPPLNRLTIGGPSIDDLEFNAPKVPVWRDRSTILGGLVNIFISFLGSSALASFYSLQGLISTLQIFALILTTIANPQDKLHKDNWEKLFLGTIPNILALNFAPAIIQSLLFLLICISVAFALLSYFYRSTLRCDRYTSVEGLQQPTSQKKQWILIIVTFLLVIMYLPLSTMSVHVLVWSEELWPIPNPYVNATTLPPVLPPLGPSKEFRDPLDFCWTTTMKRNEVNLAPIAMVFSVVVFVFYTIWFPVVLRSVIQRSVPKVDKYTELGRLRTPAELDLEYHRMLDRDKNPFSFLYSNFRRGWGVYISTYLFAKLSTLLIIAVIDSNNCLFRSLSRVTVPIVRQCLLVASTFAFFLTHSTYAPFMDPINNASEWTSRLNYLSTSVTALIINLNIPAESFFRTYVLYTIYIITYGLGFYFVIVNAGWVQSIIKKLTRRIDFSIDVYSPRLDISSSSVHTKRRIWQEAIAVLLLTNPDCRIPPEQTMSFAQSRDSEYPPYLLNFLGTPAERHVENLRILREVGSVAFIRVVALLSGPDRIRYQRMEDVIQKNYLGPDSYWKNPTGDAPRNCSGFFGNAWYIPFPPTIVIRYDDGPYAILNDAAMFEAYIQQNSSREIERKRHIRMALRALEGRVVQWPYEHVEDIGTSSIWCWRRRGYSAVASQRYHHAELAIKRRGHLKWQGMHLGSGFKLELQYTKKVVLPGEAIGLNDDFELTSSLARFLDLNRDLINEGLPQVQHKINDYLQYHRKECRWKNHVLSYRFTASVYDRPQDPTSCQLVEDCCEYEKDPRVQELMKGNETVFRSAYERLEAVSRSEAATWWYIFWDDLWRRNHSSISGLSKHAKDFNPHYRTSIAYTLLPRPALEAFLKQRGLFHTKAHFMDFIHTGFLNKLYFRLNDAVFRNTSHAIMFHLGNDRRELDMEDVDILTQGGSSTLGTGGGTDHDVSGIWARPAYRWEGLLNDPPRAGGHEGRRQWLRKLSAWFGITPLWRSGSLSNGVSLDVKMLGGKWVLLDHSIITDRH